jgi:hypothetical protein
MSKTLIAWEKGSGAGHLSRISKIAKSLEHLGQQADLAIPSHHLHNPWFTELTSKALVVHPKNCNPTYLTGIESFASMLVMYGFTDKKYLMEQVKTWISLFELKQTKNIILDYSPIAQLAAYLTGLKAYQITDGFCAPTKDCPLFPNQSFYTDEGGNNKKVIQEIDRNIAYVCEQINGHRDLDFVGYLNHPSKLYDTIPELDPYGQCRASTSLGPLTDETMFRSLTFKNLDKPLRIFLYLRNNSTVGKEILSYLISNNISTVCVYPDATSFEVQSGRNSSVTITRTPVDYDRTIRDSTHVMSYGATGTLCSSLLLGKPQLQFPVDTQKKMVCAKLQLLGTSLVVPNIKVNTNVILREFLSNDNLLDNARSFANRYKKPNFKINYDNFINEVSGK